MRPFLASKLSTLKLRSCSLPTALHWFMHLCWKLPYTAAARYSEVTRARLPSSRRCTPGTAVRPCAQLLGVLLTLLVLQQWVLLSSMAAGPQYASKQELAVMAQEHDAWLDSIDTSHIKPLDESWADHPFWADAKDVQNPETKAGQAVQQMQSEFTTEERAESCKVRRMHTSICSLYDVSWMRSPQQALHAQQHCSTLFVVVCWLTGRRKSRTHAPCQMTLQTACWQHG